MSARDTACTEGFRRTGQTLASCDDCGRPAWEHAGERRLGDPTSPFDTDARWVLVPWAPGAADAMRRRWESRDG